MVETARVLDLGTGKKLCAIGTGGGEGKDDPPGCGHYDKVRTLAWSPDGARLATGSDDLTVRVWSAEDGDELVRLLGEPPGRAGAAVWKAEWGMQGQWRACSAEQVTGWLLRAKRPAPCCACSEQACFQARRRCLYL